MLVKNDKNDTLPKFQTLEALETYERPSNMSLIEYINEFEKHLHKGKASDAQMSDDVLIYRLPKNADLRQSKEQLTKAKTVTKGTI